MLSDCFVLAPEEDQVEKLSKVFSDCFVLAPEEDQVEKLSKVCSLIVLFWHLRKIRWRS